MRRPRAFMIWISLPRSKLADIVWKEILDAFRDRRTMAAIILFPIVLVPLSLNIPFFLMSPKRNPPRVGLLQLDPSAGNLTSMLRAIEDIQVVDIPVGQNVTELISKNIFDLVLVIPENFTQIILSGGQGSLLVVYDATNTRSTTGVSIVESVRSRYSDIIVEERLERINVNPNIIEPVDLKLSSIREVTGAQAFAGMMVPYFIGIVSVIAGASFATDTTAGEKERRTLEALLTMPVSRVRIVIGKFLGVLILSVISVLFDLLGVAIGTSVLTSLFAEMSMAPGTAQLNISPGNLFIIAVSALLISMTGDAILMIVCIFAKSFKEAQQYSSVLTTAFTIPMIAVMFISPSILENLIAVPIYGPIVVMRNAVFNILAPTQLLFCLITSLFYLAVLLFLAIRLFSSERVLFRV
jgi:ABC-type Na+ efflux pump permease subunit